jgi:hypothetical protein
MNNKCRIFVRREAKNENKLIANTEEHFERENRTRKNREKNYHWSHSERSSFA